MRSGSGAAGPAVAAPLAPATPHSPATPMSACPRCAKQTNAALPYCSHCGGRTGAQAPVSSVCGGCGALVQPGIDVFCPRCGTPTTGTTPSAGASTTSSLSAQQRVAGPRIALLGESGEVTQTYTMDRGELVVGRGNGDVQFADDVFMSPVHAQFAMRDGNVVLRDLGSRNGTWLFLDGAARLADGDVMLIGSQLLRFRRLGYPGPHPPEADATRRLGSLVPSADIAVLQQLRSDGSVRDSLHLSPGRTVIIGRESGDWLFSYDQTMSGRHAEVRSEDSEFVLQDAGSRNGVAIAVRGEKPVKKGQKVLMGDHVLRMETVI